VKKSVSNRHLAKQVTAHARVYIRVCVCVSRLLMLSYMVLFSSTIFSFSIKDRNDLIKIRLLYYDYWIVFLFYFTIMLHV